MLHPQQIKAYRAMTPKQKLRAASDLYWGARPLKEAWVRQQHPDWTEEQVNAEVRRFFAHARD